VYINYHFNHLLRENRNKKSIEKFIRNIIFIMLEWNTNYRTYYMNQDTWENVTIILSVTILLVNNLNQKENNNISYYFIFHNMTYRYIIIWNINYIDMNYESLNIRELPHYFRKFFFLLIIERDIDWCWIEIFGVNNNEISTN